MEKKKKKQMCFGFIFRYKEINNDNKCNCNIYNLGYQDLKVSKTATYDVFEQQNKLMGKGIAMSF